MVGIKSRQTSMLSSKIKLTILYIINTFRRVLVTPKTHTNISRYFVLGNRLFIFLKIGLRSIFGKRRAWWNIHIFPKEIQNASEIVSLNITEFLSRVKLSEEHDRKAKFKPRLCARQNTMKLTIGLTVFYSYTWRRGWVDLIMLNKLVFMLTSIF